MDYIKAFLVGGAICTIGQLLMDKTKLQSGRILVLFVVVGCLLEGFGLYSHLVDFAGCGATVPLPGFGFALAKGAMKAVDKDGLIGVFTGGLTGTSGGIAAAIIFSFLACIMFKPKKK